MSIDPNGKTVFGGEIKIGANMSMFLSARAYFKETRGVEVLAPYYYSTDTGRNVEMSLAKFNQTGALEPECEICGEKLFKLRHDDSVGGTLEQKTFVSQKKHSIFITDSREVFLACHGISRCFSKAGFEYEETQSKGEAIRVSYTPVSFDEWIGYETNDMQIIAEISVFDTVEWSRAYRAMKKIYDEDVMVFFEKWGSKNLLKTNYFEFEQDLDPIKTRFLTLFVESERQKILKKILAYVGVR